jgi:hypothetical protein
MPGIAFAASEATDTASLGREYEKTLTRENELFLKDLVKLIEAKGYQDVRVILQMFVVTVKEADGKGRTMIIDSNSLRAFSLENDLSALMNSTASTPEGTILELH